MDLVFFHHTKPTKADVTFCSAVVVMIIIITIIIMKDNYCISTDESDLKENSLSVTSGIWNSAHLIPAVANTPLTWEYFETSSHESS